MEAVLNLLKCAGKPEAGAAQSAAGQLLPGSWSCSTALAVRSSGGWGWGWGTAVWARLPGRAGGGQPSSAPQGHRPFLEVEMDLHYHEKQCGLVGVRAADQSCSLICVCVSLAGKESSVLNWQDCERLSLQARS